MITLSNDKRQKASDIAEVFRKSGIRRPVDDLERIQRMIYPKVGFARADNAYVIKRLRN
jgi:hypothetical protein